MSDEPTKKLDEDKPLTPLLDSVTDSEPDAEEAPAAIEEKGEPVGGGNFA